MGLCTWVYIDYCLRRISQLNMFETLSYMMNINKTKNIKINK